METIGLRQCQKKYWYDEYFELYWKAMSEKREYEELEKSVKKGNARKFYEMMKVSRSQHTYDGINVET